MVSSEHKEFKSPDEIRGFEKGRLELLNIGDGVVGRWMGSNSSGRNLSLRPRLG